jgi:hypothetical protein
MPQTVDEYLLWAIAEGGRPFGTAMPAFKDALTREQIWQIITYMRAGFPPIDEGRRRLSCAERRAGAGWRAVVPRSRQAGSGARGAGCPGRPVLSYPLETGAAAPFPWLPALSMLIRVVVPVTRSCTKTSPTPLVSPGTRWSPLSRTPRSGRRR